MSKSLGNFFTVRDLLDQGVPGEVIRFVFLGTHSRNNMDWTEEKSQQAKETLKAWFRLTSGVESDPYGLTSVVPYLANDLNTPGVLHELRNLAQHDAAGQLKAAMEFIGLEASGDWWVPGSVSKEIDGFVSHVSWSGDLDPNVESRLSEISAALLRARIQAMKTKDFSSVDEMKAYLVAAGVEVRMSKEGVELTPSPNFDPTKLEGLV